MQVSYVEGSVSNNFVENTGVEMWFLIWLFQNGEARSVTLKWNSLKLLKRSA